MAEYSIRRTLPTNHYTLIGRIITRWAIIESMLNSLTSIALEVGQKEGRIAIAQRRSYEQVTLIQDILRIKKATPNIDWNKLKTTLKEMESFRNRLAHGAP